MEALVSTVLISLVLVGLGNLFLGGKRWIGHRRYQITAAQVSKVFLDPLQMDVRQDNWNLRRVQLNVSWNEPSP